MSISVVDDDLYEGFEEAEVQIRSANVSIGNFSETFLVTIIDDDQSKYIMQSICIFLKVIFRVYLYNIHYKVAVCASSSAV